MLIDLCDRVNDSKTMVKVDASRYHSSEAVKLRVDWTSETSRDSFGHVKVIIYFSRILY